MARGLVRSYYAKPEEFSASKDGCDVRMGPYRFTGDLHEYQHHGRRPMSSGRHPARGDDGSWRPETGNLLFGPHDEHVFAWTPFVPFGKVTGTYKIGDEVHEATGRGYHDHNWTNTDLGHLIDHWWWARGEVGPYTFLAAHIVATKKYGYHEFHWYMLARDGKPIADDGSKMTFTTHGAQIDEHTGKPMPDAISFDYQDGDTRYELTLTRQQTLVDYTWIDFAKGLQKTLLKLIRYPGGYMRFASTTSLKCYQDGQARRAAREHRRVRADLLRARDPRGVVGARRSPQVASSGDSAATRRGVRRARRQPEGVKRHG